jgi:hypothetical protein
MPVENPLLLKKYRPNEFLPYPPRGSVYAYANADGNLTTVDEAGEKVLIGNAVLPSEATTQEMQEGTVTDPRLMSPAGVKEAIEALGDEAPLTPTFAVSDAAGNPLRMVIGDVPNDWKTTASLGAGFGPLYIGTSATSIGDNAFESCSGITGALTIPNSVTSIGNYAFYACSGFSSVTIPNSVTSIGNGVFQNCSGFTSVTIPNSVTSIGNYAFSNNNLTSVTIPNSVTTIGSDAFANNFLTSVTIPNSVTTIGSGAFRSNSLTSVTIPASVTTIGSSAFYNNSLTSVTIPASVTTIGVEAFSNNSLTSVTIPASVTTIGSYAFYNNSTLATVNCFITKTIIDAATGIFQSTASPLTINVPTSGAVADTWTPGTGLSIGGNTNVTVVKNL